MVFGVRRKCGVPHLRRLTNISQGDTSISNFTTRWLCLTEIMEAKSTAHRHQDT